MNRKLGFLGPLIIIVGVAVAALGTWYFLHARPKAGAVIATFPIDDRQSLVVRSEADGPNGFVELHEGNELKWQAFIPHYAGTADRPALAWSRSAVSVRVERDGRAEVFALTLETSAKLGGFRLAPEREPITTQPTGPITLTDHVRSYELVGGRDWHEIVAIDLQTGKALWKVDLGKLPVQDGGVRGDHVWVVQDGHERDLAVTTGAEDKQKETTNSL